VNSSLWLLDTRRIDLVSMRALLNADEQTRADRYRQDGDAARFVSGRGALRHILGGRTGQHPRALTFAEGGGRKPALRDHPSVHFNLSHSGDFVLIAVGDAPLGVDIEAMRDLDWRALAAMNFHPDERAAVESSADPRAAFFQFWAHKEAFLKATGIGLTDRLTDISVPLAGGFVAAPKDLSAEAWFVMPLDAPQGYAASIVSGDPNLSVRVDTASFAAQTADASTLRLLR
jgi:4'-phosphopantetheinyl transferase